MNTKEKWYQSKGKECYRKHSSQARKTKIHTKISLFKRRSKEIDPLLTTENVKKKFGKNPVCYLTGISVNLSDTSTYVLDHIIPISRGGTSSLENCGLTTPQANQAKSDMTPQEFRDLCYQVVSCDSQRKL